jgi:hypothetical protein
MNRLLGVFVAIFAFILMASLAWNNRRHAIEKVAIPANQPIAMHAEYAEEKQAKEMVTLAGPMSGYMEEQKPSSQIETVQTIVYKPVASDHVGGSPVGTSRPILHQTFRVSKAVDLPFEVPAHAANAQLHGTYRSFVKQSRALQPGVPQVESQSDDADADVEFLVMTGQQFDDFLHGRPAEAFFTLEAAHDQEVNTNLPPTLDQPAKYHLVFRNSSRGKKFVQADFRLDF